jgi:hypothetical protein
MQIDFSKDEYYALLGILEIANWVLFAHKTDEPEDRKVYKDLEQKIYSFAETFGFDDLIMFDKKYKEYFPTRKQDDNSPVRSFIDEFENDSFWDELIDRLSERDIQRDIGEKKLQSMTREERLKKYLKYEQSYQEEFEEHGIDRLGIRD